MNNDKNNYAELLINRVAKNNHTKFEFIKSFDGLLSAYKYKKDMGAAYKGFKKTGKKVFKDYVKGLKQDKPDIELLASYKHIMRCANFFKEDKKIVSDMISEYNCYLRDGHLFKSIFLNYRRPEHELTDWRKLPISW